MIEQPRVLVVDDEAQVRAIICYVLDTTGYQWEEVATSTDAWTSFISGTFDLVILDVMLPDTSGIDLCNRIRQVSSIPIILLSALSDEDHRIAGLEAGADDYITKPFSPREVGLRVDAILRRQSGVAPVIEAVGIRANTITGEITYRDTTIVLPAMEIRVLATLLRTLNRTVTFSHLLSTVWNTDEAVGGREMVRITIHRLRNHLKEIGVRPDLIETVRGTGYRVREQS
ncbi:MAG: response regulator transcription factor [Actinomycetaceae bacterium]|nr:response regulator transcription factor [Actinomycetaceae bacterium]